MKGALQAQRCVEGGGVDARGAVSAGAMYRSAPLAICNPISRAGRG